MLVRDLILPNGRVMLYPTGHVVDRPPRSTDITWEEFSGYGNPPGSPTQQPYWGCNTRGDIVMNKHLENLSKP